MKKIEITKDSRWGFYDISVDGETILECLSEQEVKELTIAEIMNLANENN